MRPKAIETLFNMNFNKGNYTFQVKSQQTGTYVVLMFLKVGGGGSSTLYCQVKKIKLIKNTLMLILKIPVCGSGRLVIIQSQFRYFHSNIDMLPKSGGAGATSSYSIFYMYYMYLRKMFAAKKTGFLVVASKCSICNRMGAINNETRPF